MNRRIFLQSSLLTTASATALAKTARAVHTAPLPPTTDVCIMHVDEVVAESESATSYEHFHTLALPLAVLIQPPPAGFKIRTSPLDPDSLDLDAFNDFLRKTGLTRALQSHSHEVSITRDQLQRIASGEPKVNIKVFSPKGNFAHEFFFTASPSSLIKIKRGKSTKENT